jgi:hypothetical protein
MIFAILLTLAADAFDLAQVLVFRVMKNLPSGFEPGR